MFAPSRRTVLALTSILTALASRAGRAQATRQQPTRSFSYDDVIQQATDLAKRPFDRESARIPDELSKLSYDSYREIRFRRDKAFWRDGASDFRLLPFHLGFLHNKPVHIHIISHGTAIPIPFTTGLFEYGKVPVPKGLSPSLGFAGFAVTTNLNDLNTQDEVVSFLGASYFRLIGRSHRYGLSARSLALDVGGEGPEEFPFMRALWLEEPTQDATELVIYALVDSPSVAGAFRYIVRPGRETHMDVTATLIARREIERIGIAPLTSMFQAGEGNLSQRTDFRPEIHDSDGLMMHSGRGEWIWRPIRNPKSLRKSSFDENSPRGFGLMQRDRDFGSYQDLEARYEERPGYWVQPQGNWGAGRIELIEIPTLNETFDNIVTVWTPKTPLPTGQATEFRYRISALSTTWHLHPHAQVQQSFDGADREGSVSDVKGTKRFIVDFAGGDLAHYQSAPDRLELVATTTAGEITAKILTLNRPMKGVRAIVDAKLPNGQSAELRMFLKSRARTLSETWTSTWSVPSGDAARTRSSQN